MPKLELTEREAGYLRADCRADWLFCEKECIRLEKSLAPGSGPILDQTEECMLLAGQILAKLRQPVDAGEGE